MVVHLFRHQRSARHEAEGLVEILEFESLADGITVSDLAPTAQLGERGGAGFTGQFLSHRDTSPYVPGDRPRSPYPRDGPILPRIATGSPLVKRPGSA